jgi:hypothetical protein
MATLAASSSSAWAGIDDVKVTTDTSIDCSSVQTMARDLYASSKTDQDKAVATWYFVRRVCYHWPDIPTGDPISLVNSYGFALCGHQSQILAQIMSAGGLKSRLMHLPNHVIAEAYYDGAWHMFDCQVGWYVLDRQGKVASCEQIKADPSIVLDARKEGRESKPFFQCSDNEKSGVGIGSSAKPGGVAAPASNRLVIRLRRGESITRNWSNEGKPWFNKENTKFTRPAHLCTRAAVDANDPVNWPYWQPYAEVTGNRPDGTPVYGIKRTYGNGRLVYEPDLTTDAFTDGLDKDGLVNIQAGTQGSGRPNLRPAAAGRDASATFLVESAYVMTDAWLDASAVRKGEGDVLAVAIRGVGGWVEAYKADKTGEPKLENINFRDAVSGAKRYLLRFTMKAGASAGDVGVNAFRLTTVIMNNIYALPYFMPGKNTIRVAAADGADLARNKLTLEYAWWDGQEAKGLTTQIDKLPFECTVDVQQKGVPKMKFVRLSVAR